MTLLLDAVILFGNSTCRQIFGSLPAELLRCGLLLDDSFISSLALCSLPLMSILVFTMVWADWCCMYRLGMWAWDRYVSQHFWSAVSYLFLGSSTSTGCKSIGEIALSVSLMVHHSFILHLYIGSTGQDDGRWLLRWMQQSYLYRWGIPDLLKFCFCELSRSHVLPMLLVLWLPLLHFAMLSSAHFAADAAQNDAWRAKHTVKPTVSCRCSW